MRVDPGVCAFLRRGDRRGGLDVGLEGEAILRNLEDPAQRNLGFVEDLAILVGDDAAGVDAEEGLGDARAEKAVVRQEDPLGGLQADNLGHRLEHLDRELVPGADLVEGDEFAVLRVLDLVRDAEDVGELVGVLRSVEAEARHRVERRDLFHRQVVHQRADHGFDRAVRAGRNAQIVVVLGDLRAQVADLLPARRCEVTVEVDPPGGFVLGPGFAVAHDVDLSIGVERIGERELQKGNPRLEVDPRGCESCEHENSFLVDLR